MSDRSTGRHAESGMLNCFRAWQELDAAAASERIAHLLSEVPAQEQQAAIRLLADEKTRIAAFRESGSGGPGAPLSGIPFLIKDLFDRAGELTGAGSTLLEAVKRPAAQNARAVQAVNDVGGVCIGRTQMNEFAYGLDGRNAHFGNCPHPRAAERISGGSSSGSAWAVGRGVVPLALGSDTGGSIRVPASLCGVYGFRRAVDEWASEGVFPLARTFDTVGWFCANANDMKRCIELFYPAGKRSPDTLSVCWLVPDHVVIDRALSEAYEIVLRRYADVLVRPEREAVRILTEESADICEAYNIIGSSDAFDVHREWLDARKEEYDPVVWPLIDRGRRWSETQRSWAYRTRSRVADACEELLSEFDAVAMPAVHTVAPRHEDVDAAYRRSVLTLNAAGSHAGLPALTLPVNPGGMLTGGVQLLMKPGRERAVCGALLERIEQQDGPHSGELFA